jgi:hypothetical protein
MYHKIWYLSSSCHKIKNFVYYNKMNILKLFYEQIKGKPEVQQQPVKLTMKEENYVS